MKWGDFIARTAVRRVVYVLVALVLAWAGIGRAESATPYTCTNTATPGCDKPTAYQECMALGAEWAAGASNRHSVVCTDQPATASQGTFRCTATVGSIQGAYCQPSQFNYRQGCPVGTEWNNWAGSCSTPCSTRGPNDGGLSRSATFCSGGCMYAANGFTMTIQTDGGPVSVYTGKGATPTGQTCAVGEGDGLSENPQECVPVAGQSVCMKPDGKHCYSASTGRQICWQPGETGEKNDGDIRQGRSPGESPISPQPIPGDTLTPTGDPITTTTTTGTGRTITTTTQNYSTGSGADAGKGGQGESGTGDGSGSGNGNGDGDGDGDEDGPGQPGEGVGDLYESDGTTIDGVIANFRTKVMQSPLIGAASGFMGNCSFGGQCPVWTYDGGEYMGALTFDALCNGALQGLLSYGGYIVLALGAFAAFRIGVY